MIDGREDLTGVVHGKTIDLARESGLPDGQSVRVRLEAVSIPENWYDRIEVISPALPVIRGTHVPAERVVELLDHGLSTAEVQASLPELAPEDIDAVREFARVPKGLRQSFGAWAEDAKELDEFLDWNRAQRAENQRTGTE